MPGLCLDSVSYSYPGRPGVLCDASMAIDEGEAVAVIGSSGAGKSTLFRIAAGLAVPPQGRVALGGADLYATPATGRGGAIGYVHQQHGLAPGISVEMAVLGGVMHSWNTAKLLISPLVGPTRAERELVGEVLARVGLEGRGEDRVAELSVGQRQRVAVARTLLQRPSLIVADEPVASVDPATADVVLGLLVGETARGAAVLCSVHDVEKARRHFARIVALSSGHIVFDGSREDLTDEIVAGVYGSETA